nr:MAG TPA: hypothetical protein [Caudoviricetes sp.]
MKLHLILTAYLLCNAFCSIYSEPAHHALMYL